MIDEDLSCQFAVSEAGEPTLPALKDAAKVQPAGNSDSRGHMTVGQRSSNRDGVFDVVEDNTSLEDGAEALDDAGWHYGEIGAGFMAHPLAFTPGMPDEGLERTSVV